MKTNTREEIVDQIFFEVLSWYLDEGDYQPTEEQARDIVKQIISDLLSLERKRIREIVEELPESCDAGCQIILLEELDNQGESDK